MKNLLLAAVAVATISIAAPASAQIYGGIDPGGVGVRIGPFGVGIGPDYGWRAPAYAYEPAYAYGGCRLIRERIVRPSGRVIYRSRRVCY